MRRNCKPVDVTRRSEYIYCVVVDQSLIYLPSAVPLLILNGHSPSFFSKPAISPAERIFPTETTLSPTTSAGVEITPYETIRAMSVTFSTSGSRPMEAAESVCPARVLSHLIPNI